MISSGEYLQNCSSHKKQDCISVCALQCFNISDVFVLQRLTPNLLRCAQTSSSVTKVPENLLHLTVSLKFRVVLLQNGAQLEIGSVESQKAKLWWSHCY